MAGSGADPRVSLGALLEVILAIAGIGSAVVLYPVVKRQNGIVDVLGHGHDDPAVHPPRAVDDVEVPVMDRIEAPGIKGNRERVLPQTPSSFFAAVA